MEAIPLIPPAPYFRRRAANAQGNEGSASPNVPLAISLARGAC
jgi:hypothetical protein